MKINQVSSGHTEAVAGSAQKKMDRVTSNKPETAGESNSVHISPLSRSIQALDAGSEINTVKVAEIKQAISEGRFKVNPAVVADRLLETVKELIQNKQ